MSVSLNCIFLFFLFNSTQPISSSSSSSQTSPLFLQPSLLPNKSSSSPSPSPSPSPHIHHPRKHKHNYPSNLFFPSDPSPPPNSVPVLPANVSSPALSNTTASSKSSSKLIVIVISLAVFLLLILLIAALIIFRRKNTGTKVDRSDSIRLYPRNTSVSDSKSPPRSLPFDSPELRPLPPLPKENLSGKQYYYNTAYEGTREEEFFSPIGFSGSPNAAASSTGSVTGARISRSHSLNSEISSYPSSSSVSYSRTISRCPSIPSNSTASKNLPATLRQHEMRIFTESPTPQRNSMYTHNSDEILSYGSVPLPPIPPSLPPPRFSKMWRQIQDSPELEIPAKPSAELQTRGKNNECGETSDQNVKPRLKALHWDKVRPSSDRAMVWDKLKSTSFQLNEEMIETLFIVNSSNLNRNDKISPPLFPLAKQEKRVLDLKKSQNIAILLKALNVTIDEVCEALLEGNTDTPGTEFLECLLKMAPSKAEELKLRDFEETSLLKLGPAEKFLKAILDIPFAFQRIDAMLYVANFDSEAEDLIRSFKILEAACEELRSSRMFKKLLEAVLKTGNRMNVGTNLGDAAAFRLDTLLKLVDVKGTDGKTTLLHFVVQEIVRTEINQQSALSEETEFRKLGLQLVSSLSRELTNVIKSAALELDILNTEVGKLSTGITRIVEVIKLDRELKLSESSTKFSNSMNGFLKKAKEEIIRIQARQSVTLSLVKEITGYFYGNSAIEEAHPFRVFLVVRDFLSILDQVCREVGNMNERNVISSVRRVPLTVSKDHPSVFRGVNRIQQDCSSDDESF